MPKNHLLYFLFMSNLAFAMQTTPILIETELHKYAKQPDAIKALETLIQQKKKLGESIDPRDQRGFTPLLVALTENNCGAAKVLLDEGADCTLIDKNGMNASHHAALSGNLRMIDELSQKKLLCFIADNDSNTILHMATFVNPLLQEQSAKDQLKMKQALVADFVLSGLSENVKDVLLKTKNRYGQTPLDAAHFYCNWLVFGVFQKHSKLSKHKLELQAVSREFVQLIISLQKDKEQFEQRAHHAEQALKLLQESNKK